MSLNHTPSRRDVLGALGFGLATAPMSLTGVGERETTAGTLDPAFPVTPEELTLRFRHGSGDRRLSFSKHTGSLESWKTSCREKLTELLAFTKPVPGPTKKLRSVEHEGVNIEAWVMAIDSSLSIPAYVLIPREPQAENTAVMAIHGHGRAEPCIGVEDDYHHMFALELAKSGRIVICPAQRGFGSLGDVAFGDEDTCLDYWISTRGRQFTLVTDAFLYGKSLVGENVEDLLRWETWLAETRSIESFDAVGISYGGDLAITYPVFSRRVSRIYTSGSMGSFSVIFSRCYNAPAHCIPGVLEWMDRSDIAGLNAPRPIRLHYGEKDTPGPRNNSASYNETVEPALAELKAIYRASGAEDQISLYVTPNSEHEMDITDVKKWS
jgi:hypothetical protein